MQRTRVWLARLAVLAAVGSGAAIVPGCALFEPQSKIRSGQLFQTGQSQYDDYFSKVHALQLEAAGWTDEKKATRRSLIDALKIATDAADVTIVEAAHERMVSVAHVIGGTHLELKENEGKLVIPGESRADAPMKDFLTALRTTVDGEMKRKRELTDIPQKCDELVKLGRDLEPRVKADFFRQGGTMMADVHDEIAASFDVLSEISKTSRLQKRETEDFISDLARAVEAGPPANDLPPSTVTKPATHPKPFVSSSQATTTTPKPKPKPKPQPSGGGGGGDDFNP